MCGFSPVSCSSAVAASRSQLDPGKTTTADFMGSPFQFDLVFLDHRVGEKFLAHLFEARARGRFVFLRELDVDHLALAHVAALPEAEPVQRMANGFALRVENAVFESDEHARFHANSARYFSLDPRLSSFAKAS